MILKALNIKGIIFEGAVKSVNLKTRSGEITILDKHRPLVTLLEKGEVKIKMADGKEKGVPINSGFLEMNAQNMLTLLVD